MTGKPTTFDDHDPLAQSIYEVLKSFADEIGDRGCASHFDDVLQGSSFLTGKHLTQQPERFIEDHLVFPMLEDGFNHQVRPRPKQYAPRWKKDSGVPDFCLTTIPIEAAMDAELRIFGEVKTPKQLTLGQRQMKEYLNKDVDFDAIAIITDGFDWELWTRPCGIAVDKIDDPDATASLRDPLKAICARNLEIDTSQPYNVRDRIDSEAFAPFTASSILNRVEPELMSPSSTHGDVLRGP